MVNFFSSDLRFLQTNGYKENSTGKFEIFKPWQVI